MKQFFLLSLICCMTWTMVIAQIGPGRKISPGLQNEIRTKNKNEQVEVLAFVRDISDLYKTDSIRIIHGYVPGRAVIIRLTFARLLSLMDSGAILFADRYRSPKEELTTGTLDLATNRINWSHDQFPFVNGDSIFTSVKEQRFDTADIDIKGRYFDSHVEAPFSSSHASIMATMLAGAANSSPFAKGAAWGCYISSSDFSSLLPDADSVYQAYHITIQNHSYGTGIENYYGADAAAFDQSMKNNPFLIHVFSSGNSGTSTPPTGTYAGIQGFANLTGSFKMAKNILTVGATDSFSHVVAASSRGPAYDGRVKPELVAFGEDGSSGAAALVSGSAALVQQAYRLAHHPALPASALVKAVLLNSADDIEAPHIDYSSGYGALNAHAAVATILQNRFREGVVAQDEIRSFPITLPPNVTQLRCTLVWMDVPAAPNAPRALVNDLDAQLKRPSAGESWLPWVLSPAASSDSLLRTAERRVDTLNPVEQITVDNPQGGDYVLEVRGSRVQAGTSQAFALAYQWDTAGHFVWTYPTSSDALASSAEHILRWETTISDTATIDYSTDGLQWTTIAHGVDLRSRYYRWLTPEFTSIAFVRMTVPGAASPFISDSFTISHEIKLRVGFDCADSFLLYWNKLSVPRYQLYQLGQKYLQPFRSTTDTTVVLSKNQFPSHQYAVAPLLLSKTGLRSFTTDYTTQGTGCYVNSFLAGLQNSSAVLAIQLGTVYNIASLSVIRINSTGTKTVQTVLPPLSTLITLSDTGLARGVNRYQLQIRLADGSVIYSDVQEVYYFPDVPVIVYPNPARQNEGVRIIAQTPGEYSIIIYDAIGRKILVRDLDDVNQQQSTLRFSKGVYFVRVTGKGSTHFVQKLIIY